MVQIFFTGSQDVNEELCDVLEGYARMTVLSMADMCICEVSTANDVAKIPPKLNIPLFVYINTRNKQILDMLFRFRIAGIIYPPVDSTGLKHKIDVVLKQYAVQHSATAVDDFDKIKVKILAKAESIPMLPLFVHKLIMLTSRNDTTIADLTNEIKKDQGISGRVLRMVNSPFFVVSQQVNSIDRAVVLLGFQTLKNIALAASTGTYYNKQFKLYKTTGRALWGHSYTVALLCEAMAQETGLDPDMLFIAGLFHDIGKTIIVDFLVQEVSSLEEECSQLGMDHAEVSALVVRRWQLADDIVDAIARHHAPDDKLATRILYHANRLAHFIKDEEGKQEQGPQEEDRVDVIAELKADITVKDRDGFIQRLINIAKSSEEVAM